MICKFAFFGSTSILLLPFKLPFSGVTRVRHHPARRVVRLLLCGSLSLSNVVVDRVYRSIFDDDTYAALGGTFPVSYTWSPWQLNKSFVSAKPPAQRVGEITRRTLLLICCSAVE